MYEEFIAVAGMAALAQAALTIAGYFQKRKEATQLQIAGKGSKPEPFDVYTLGTQVVSVAVLAIASTFAGFYPALAAVFGAFLYEVARRLLKGYQLPALPKLG